MEPEKKVSVLIVDQQLEHKGIIANASFVLGLTAGRSMPDESFGTDVIDGDGRTHKYLTCIGHFVRKAGQSKIKTLRETLEKSKDITIVDYTEDAAPADYNEYATQLGNNKNDNIRYRAIHLFGPESLIVPATKNLSRLD